LRYYLEIYKGQGREWSEAWNVSLALVLRDLPEGYERRSWLRAFLYARAVWHASYFEF
jgi:hypothetical protein